MGRRAWLGGLVLAVAVVACQLVAGIQRTDKADPPVAVVDGAVDAATPDPCQHVAAPPRPDRDDDGGTSPGVLYFAMREMHLTPVDDAGVPLGFDLDGVCTCDGRRGAPYDGGSSCVPPATATEVPCDGDGGVDNELTLTLRPYETFGPTADQSAHLNDKFALGQLGLLVYLADYNGTKNDREVKVSMLLSNGIADPAGCSTEEQTSLDPPRYKPQWCGKDRWSYDPSAMVTGSTLPLIIGSGWVNDGRLAYTATQASILFNNVPLRLVSVHSVARLSEVATGYYRLEGVIAARVLADELLRASAPGWIWPRARGSTSKGPPARACRSPSPSRPRARTSEGSSKAPTRRSTVRTMRGSMRVPHGDAVAGGPAGGPR
jgi:hypothetical protein